MATATEETLTVIERPELTLFRRQDVAIKKMVDESAGLTISGIDDKEGFEKVHAARMKLKETRIKVENKRVELKAEALRYGRVVEEEANRLKAMIEPEETRLHGEEKKIAAAKEAILEAARQARAAKLQGRLDKLIAVGSVPNAAMVEMMSDEHFAGHLDVATKLFSEKQKAEAEAKSKQEAEEKAAAEARRKIDEEQSAERARQAEVAKQQAAEQAKLQAERDALAAFQRRLDEQEAKRIADETKAADDKRRAEELEKAKAEAAERARIETERRLAAEAEDKRIAAERAEAARLKAEAERPIRDKITAYAKSLRTLPIHVGGAVSDKIRSIVGKAATAIEKIAAEALED